MINMLFALFIATMSAHAATPLNNAEDIAKAFAKHRPMVILFHAEWCSWCKKMGPEYAKAEEELKDQVDFYIMDVDKVQLKMTKQYQGIPAMVCGDNEAFIRTGRSINDGYIPAEQIVTYLKYTLSHEEEILKGTM